MLIENKFIYLNLPRCASTSFHIACLKYGLDIKYFDDIIHKINPPILKKNANNEIIADNLTHTHEKIYSLKKKFGNLIPIISVKRDPYERYISLWKHVLDELYRVGDTQTFEILKSLDTDALLSYTELDLSSNEKKYLAIKEFFEKNNISKKRKYLTSMMFMVMSPTSHYHNNDESIIWFDFKKLIELENWVSQKLGFNFKLEKINSSQNFECSIINDEYFRKKYDSIYRRYDNPKSNISLI